MGSQLGAAEFNCVPVVEDAIDLGARTSGCGAFRFGNVGIHDHEPRTGLLLHDAYSGIMIAVRMAGEKDLRVAVFETALADALFDLRKILGKIGIDQNISLRRVDQVNGEIRSEEHTSELQSLTNLVCRL